MRVRIRIGESFLIDIGGVNGGLGGQKEPGLYDSSLIVREVSIPERPEHSYSDSSGFIRVAENAQEEGHQAGIPKRLEIQQHVQLPGAIGMRRLE